MKGYTEDWGDRQLSELLLANKSFKNIGLNSFEVDDVPLDQFDQDLTVYSMVKHEKDGMIYAVMGTHPPTFTNIQGGEAAQQVASV